MNARNDGVSVGIGGHGQAEGAATRASELVGGIAVLALWALLLGLACQAGHAVDSVRSRLPVILILPGGAVLYLELATAATSGPQTRRSHGSRTEDTGASRRLQRASAAVRSAARRGRRPTLAVPALWLASSTSSTRPSRSRSARERRPGRRKPVAHDHDEIAVHMSNHGLKPGDAVRQMIPGDMSYLELVPLGELPRAARRGPVYLVTSAESDFVLLTPVE